ncbi:MAG TPA: hypothetical protein VEL07_00605 [Planctomycetota bacterium]|nr:hypothetical protein [Planctomycetota bacterium]
MRLIACLLIVVASLGASEERFVKRFDDAMDVLKRGADRTLEQGVVEASRILVEGGAVPPAAVEGALRTLLEADGPVVRWDRLGDREFGSHAQVFYVLVVFERGVAFARVVAAKTKTDQTIIASITIQVDPVGILPEAMLLPDAR